MEDYEILHNFVMLNLFVFPSFATCYVPCLHWQDWCISRNPAQSA